MTSIPATWRSRQRATSAARGLRFCGALRRFLDLFHLVPEPAPDRRGSGLAGLLDRLACTFPPAPAVAGEPMLGERGKCCRCGYRDPFCDAWTLADLAECGASSPL